MSARISVAELCTELILVDDNGKIVRTIYRDTLSQAENLAKAYNAKIESVEVLDF